MGLTLAELDAWDPEAVHSVFSAAIARADGTRTGAENIGNVMTSVPGEGQAHDAALAATGNILADLTSHAEECEAVGRAAETAEAEIRSVKDEWRAIQRMADKWGITIDIDTNEVSYTPPAVPPATEADAKEKALEFDIVHAKIQDVLARADTADADLAAAIRGAAGQESAADVDNQLHSHGIQAAPQPMSQQAGTDDGQAIINGTATPQQLERLRAATTLTPDQLAAVARGDLALPPDQLAYLTGLSQSFGDKTPDEINAIEDKLGPDGGRVSDAFQLASNPNIKTGLPTTVGTPGQPGYLPARGGQAALPQGIQRVLSEPVLQQFTPPPPGPDGKPQMYPAPVPSKGLGALANLVGRGNPGLQVGTDLDTGLMNQSRELLKETKTAALPLTADGNTINRTAWYQNLDDPTLQDMLTSAGRDNMVVHDAVTAPDGQEFVGNLAHQQWADHGQAAGSMFSNIESQATMTNADDLTQQILAKRAGETAHAAATYLGGHSSELLDLDGTKHSLGDINPQLTQSLAHALRPYIPDMMNNALDKTLGFTPLDDPAAFNNSHVLPHTKGLFTVLDTDPTAARDFNAQAMADGVRYQDGVAQSIINHDPNGINADDMRSLGQLHALIDSANTAQINNHIAQTNAADKDSYDNRSDWADEAAKITGRLVDKVPVVGPYLGDGVDYLKKLFLGPAPTPHPDVPVSPRGLEPVEYPIVQALAQAKLGDPSLLRPLLDPAGNPESFPEAAANQRFETGLFNYLSSIKDIDMASLWAIYTNGYTNVIDNNK